MKTLSDKELKDVLAEPVEFEKQEKEPPDPVAVILRSIRSEVIAIRAKIDEPAEREKAPDMTSKFDRVIGLLEQLVRLDKKEPDKAPMPCDYDFQIVRDSKGDIENIKARVIR